MNDCNISLGETIDKSITFQSSNFDLTAVNKRIKMSKHPHMDGFNSIAVTMNGETFVFQITRASHSTVYIKSSDLRRLYLEALHP